MIVFVHVNTAREHDGSTILTTISFSYEKTLNILLHEKSGKVCQSLRDARDASKKSKLVCMAWSSKVMESFVRQVVRARTPTRSMRSVENSCINLDTVPATKLSRS